LGQGGKRGSEGSRGVVCPSTTHTHTHTHTHTYKHMAIQIRERSATRSAVAH